MCVFFLLNSLDPTCRQEIRESYDVSSADGVFPDEHAPEFHQAIEELGPKLCHLTIRILNCMALALGSPYTMLNHSVLQSRRPFEQAWRRTFSAANIVTFSKERIKTEQYFELSSTRPLPIRKSNRVWSAAASITITDLLSYSCRTLWADWRQVFGHRFKITVINVF